MARRALLVAALIAALAGSACFGPDPNRTVDDKGLPEVQVRFPEIVTPGSVEEMIVTVSNPGPGDMSSLTIAFSRVGIGGSDPVPDPIVDVGVQGESNQIESIQPSPNSVSADAQVYVFDGLDEGEEASFTFEVLVPRTPGLLANSVVAYESQDVDRARGVRVQTQVRG